MWAKVLVFDGVAIVLLGGDGEPTRRRCHHELVFDIARRIRDHSPTLAKALDGALWCWLS